MTVAAVGTAVGTSVGTAVASLHFVRARDEPPPALVETFLEILPMTHRFLPPQILSLFSLLLSPLSAPLVARLFVPRFASASVPNVAGLTTVAALSACLIAFAPAAAAQTNGVPSAVTDAASAASAAAATASAADVAAAPANVSPPKTPPEQVGKLTLDQQVKWLQRAAQSGMLETLSDDALTSLFRSLDPLAVPRYIREGPNGYPSYTFTMLRSERIRGQWPSKPDHMLVKLTREPLRIYAKWLPDGAHAGQEIIYDETKRSDEMYGHLGGILGMMPLWTSITGTLAHSQSNHQVRDLGTEFIATQYLNEGKQLAKAGDAPQQTIDVKTIDGVRVVTFTFDTPTGQPQYYAKKETLGLDLRHPYFRTVESYSNDGQLFERIVFEKIMPQTLDDSAFDPKNRAYKF